MLCMANECVWDFGWGLRRLATPGFPVQGGRLVSSDRYRTGRLRPENASRSWRIWAAGSLGPSFRLSDSECSSQPHHGENPGQGKKKKTSTKTKQGTLCSRSLVGGRVGARRIYDRYPWSQGLRSSRAVPSDYRNPPPPRPAPIDIIIIAS